MMGRIDPGRKNSSNCRYGRHQQTCTRSEPVTSCPYLGKLTVQLSVQQVVVMDSHASVPPQVCALSAQHTERQG
jgi:hypothetical protein